MFDFIGTKLVDAIFRLFLLRIRSLLSTAIGILVRAERKEDNILYFKSERRNRHQYIFLLLPVGISAVDEVILPDADRTYDDISVANAQAMVAELENYYSGLRGNVLDSCGSSP